MRVLLTADTVGGVWTFALELARGLWEFGGAEMVLATMGARMTPDQRLAARAVPGLTVAEGDHRLEWMADPWDDVDRAADWLLALERRHRPDVVHLNGTLSHGALPWRAPVVVTAHSCVCSWWRAVKGCDAPECDWGHYRRAVACGLHAADVVAAPTHAMLNDLAVPYGRPSRSVVVPNGRCPESFSRPNVAKEPFVLSAGRFWDEAKNVETLLVAAPSLPWPVFLAGEAGDQGKSAPRNVRLLGRLDAGAMVALMARASVFASPARYEPFGLTALEAALSGCALVLGDLPSLREVWGDAALFVPPDDPKALSVAVNSLICDARRRAEFATRARDRAAEYTAERMARGYLALYDDLIAARSGEGAARLTRDPLAAVPSLPAGAAPAKASSWRLCTAWTEGTCDA